MSDMRDFLKRGIESFNPSPQEALERTRDRTRRRHRRRQVLAGAVTVAMFGGTLAGAVWLGSQRGRPIAGPTPSPSASVDALHGFHQVETNEGTWLCKGLTCFARTSHVLNIASGTEAGASWSLRAFSVLYWGPNIAREDGPRGRWAMVCTDWQRGNHPAFVTCSRTLKAGQLVHMELPSVVLEIPLARISQPLESGPLWDHEHTGGGFMWDSGSPNQGVWGWTPAGTKRLDVRVDDTVLGPALLAGPFEGLQTSVKWFVAFVPRDSRVMFTAYDNSGDELWHGQEDPPPEPAGPSSDPVPTSPEVVVARGTHGDRDWVMRAQLFNLDGQEEICLQFSYVGYTDDAGGGCTLSRDLSEDSGLLGWGGNLDFPLVLFGFAPLETAEVEVEYKGDVNEAFLFRAPSDLGGDFQFVVGFAPSLDAPVVTIGYDAGGHEIWRDVK